MGNSSVNATNPSEVILGFIGRKFVSGNKLTLAENLMALSASAQLTADMYGPGPSTMVLKPMELPESVKGLLANYAS